MFDFDYNPNEDFNSDETKIFEVGKLKLKKLSKKFEYDSFIWRELEWKKLVGEIEWCLN